MRKGNGVGSGAQGELLLCVDVTWPHSSTLVAGFLFVFLDGWLDLKVTEQFGCGYSRKYPWQKFSLKHMGVENIIQSWKELKRSFAVGCAGI